MHLNALKGYVDMKFDVLKGMVSKYSSKKGAKAPELGEGARMKKKMAQAHTHLSRTFDAFARSE